MVGEKVKLFEFDFVLPELGSSVRIMANRVGKWIWICYVPMN